MKIHTFHGTGINGHLDIGLNLHDDCSFLTGINGSGKTTTLNLISSLIFPKLEVLSSHAFKKLSLTMEISGKKFILTAIRSHNIIEIANSNIKNKKFKFQTFNGYMNDFKGDRHIPLSELNQERRRYYQRIEIENEENEVLQNLHALPNPIFLTLDRRFKGEGQVGSSSRYRSSSTNADRNRLLDSSLGISLSETIDFVSFAISKCFVSKDKLDENLSNNLMAELLNFSPIELNKLTIGKTNLNVKKLNQIKGDIDNLPKIGAISDEQKDNLKLFIDFLKNKLDIVKNKNGRCRKLLI